MGLSANDKTVEVFQDNAVVGWCFTKRGTDPGADQIQRWYLKSTYRMPSYSGGTAINPVRLRYPTDTGWQITTQAAWVARVAPLMTTGDHYIKVNCAYDKTNRSPGWATIPSDLAPYYPPYPALTVASEESAAAAAAVRALAGAIAARSPTTFRAEHLSIEWEGGVLDIERLVYRASRHGHPGFMQFDDGTLQLFQGVLKGYEYTTVQQKNPQNWPNLSREHFLFESGYTLARSKARSTPRKKGALVAGFVPVPGADNLSSADLQARADWGTGLSGWITEMNNAHWTADSRMVLASCAWAHDRFPSNP